MAANQSFCPQILGYCPTTTGSTTLALNATATWQAYSIIPKSSKTLNALRFYVSAVTGSPTAANITVEIQTDSGSGTPSGTAVTGGSAQALTATPAVGFNSASGFTCALTGGTPYWAVVKNGNATPASNSITVKNFAFGTVLPGNFWNVGVSGAVYQQGCPTTTNSGTSWTNGRAFWPNIRMDWSDTSYEGLPISAQAIISTVAQGNATPTEVGAKFTIPGSSSLTYNVAGIMLAVAKSGTPAGFPQFRIYLGSSTTPTATTGNPATNDLPGSANANLVPLYFSSAQAITGGQTVRITLSDTAAETASNGYQLAIANTLDTDSNSASLVPFSGTWQQTVLSGGAWTDTAGILPFGGLLLDSTGEFTAAASGSGPGGMMHPSIYWEV